MKGTEHFKQTIKEYLDGRAQTDELFAVSYAKENKNLDDCITFILNQVKASGCCGMTDDEVWSLAIHYYPKYIKIQSHHIRYPYNQCIIRLTLCYDFG